MAGGRMCVGVRGTEVPGCIQRSLRDDVCVGIWPVPACYTIRSIDLTGKIAALCLISGRYFCV